MRLLAIAPLIFFVGPGWAGDDPPPTPATQDQAQHQGQAQAQKQAQAQAQGQKQFTVATQDNLQSNDQNQTNDQANTQSASISNDYEANAPSIAIYSAPSTARFMTCKGIGGSEKGGAATGLWCNIQRDLYAEHRSDRYAEAGEYQIAAVTYCARRLHHQDFGGRAKCVEQYPGVLRKRYGEPDNVTITNITAELTELKATLVEVREQPGYDDAALVERIKFLEGVAHAPSSRQSLLLSKGE